MSEASVAVDGLTNSNNVEESTDFLTDYFLGHPPTRAIATIGPFPAGAFYLYMDDRGAEAGELLHVTLDTSQTIFDRIAQGYTIQTIDQQPYLQGYLTVLFLYFNCKYGLELALDVLTSAFAINSDILRQIKRLVKKGSIDCITY